MLAVSGTTACGTNPISPIATTTYNFLSRIQEGRSAWRSFPMTTAGDATLQLTSVTQTDAVMRLSLGTLNGTTCTVTKSVDTVASNLAASPQITATLAVGNYCVMVQDIGNITQIVDFSVLITVPY